MKGPQKTRFTLNMNILKYLDGTVKEMNPRLTITASYYNKAEAVCLHGPIMSVRTRVQGLNKAMAQSVCPEPHRD